MTVAPEASVTGALLIVDDDATSVEILSALARRAGYDVRFALDGVAG